MVDTTKIILEYIVPGCGVIMGNVMFAAPWKDIYASSRLGYFINGLNPLPWIFMIGNCFGWVMYGILKQNLFVFIGNAPGFLLSIWYVSQGIKLIYAKQFYSLQYQENIISTIQNYKEKQKKIKQTNDDNGADANKNNHIKTSDVENQDDDDDDDHYSPSSIENLIRHIQETTIDRASIYGNIAIAHNQTTTIDHDDSNKNIFQTIPIPKQYELCLLVVCILWLVIVSIVSFANAFDHNTKVLIVGFSVNLNLIFFYGAPLSTIRTVLSTHDSSSIHVPTMFLNTINGTFWLIYGLAVKDWFIAIPNGAGTLLGLVQILLWFLYPRNEKSSPTSYRDDVDNRNNDTIPKNLPHSNFDHNHHHPIADKSSHNGDERYVTPTVELSDLAEK